MRRFLSSSAILCVIVSLCNLQAVRVGATQVTNFSRLFTNADGSPCDNCLFGIVLGRATFADAARLLAIHPLTSTMTMLQPTNKDVRSYAASEVVLTLQRRSSDGKISEAMLFFYNNDPTLPSSGIGTVRLADAWLTLNDPNEVSIVIDPTRLASSPRNYATWRYETANYHLLVVARLRTNRMNAAAPLTHLHLSDDGAILGLYNPANFASRVTVNYDSFRWHGFRSVLTYIREATSRLSGR